MSDQEPNWNPAAYDELLAQLPDTQEMRDFAGDLAARVDGQLIRAYHLRELHLLGESRQETGSRISTIHVEDNAGRPRGMLVFHFIVGEQEELPTVLKVQWSARTLPKI